MIFLVLSRDEKSAFNLRSLNVLYTCRYIIQLPLMKLSIDARQDLQDHYHLDTAMWLSRIYECICVFCMYFTVSAYSPEDDERILYLYTWAQLYIFATLVLGPLIICLCMPVFIICVPLLFGIASNSILPDSGADQEQIDTLESHFYGAPDSPKDTFQQAECSVCMCEYKQGEELRLLDCGHSFHQECIDTWLKKKAACPLCREWVFEDRRRNHEIREGWMRI